MLIRRTPMRNFLLIAVLCLLGVREFHAAQRASPAHSGNAGGYRIAGMVVNKIDSSPLARARVILRDTKNPQKFQSVVTSEDGKFEFNDLPAGKYSLEGAKRGFIFGSYDQHDQFSTAIVTGAGLETENLILKLAPHAVIGGKVLDEVGEPVRHATVTLYYDNHRQGVDEIHMIRSAQTDDLGAYEMTPLMPGTYFLSVTAKPWYGMHPPSEPVNSNPDRQEPLPSAIDRSLDVAYPVTYYADVTDAESATPIPVRGGEHVQVDIHVNPVPALRLIFHVSGNENRFPMPQLEQPAFDGATFVPSGGGRSISPGVWEVFGIPAGRYNIRIPGEGAGAQMNGVDLTKDGEDVDTSTAEAFSSVKVTVQVPGETPVPTGLMIGLRGRSRFFSPWHAVDSKGEAEFDQVAAGQYELAVTARDKRYSIAQVSTEGAQVSGHTVTVPVGASLSLAVALVAGSAEIEGKAERAGKAFAGAMVVLVPKNPEGNRDLFRRDQSDLDGTFALHNVVPGSYTILAIENGWDLDWSQREVIAAYLKHGRKVEVGDQLHRPLSLAEPIEVQSK